MSAPPLTIEYTDAHGNETRRTITPRDVREEPTGIMLDAHCHLSNAFRTFRIDRIDNVITADGEVIPAVEYFAEDRNGSSITHAEKPIWGWVAFLLWIAFMYWAVRPTNEAEFGVFCFAVLLPAAMAFIAFKAVKLMSRIFRR